MQEKNVTKIYFFFMQFYVVNNNCSFITMLQSKQTL